MPRIVGCLFLAPECLDHFARALDTNRGDEDRQVDTGTTKGRELLPASGERTAETHGIENAIAQRRSASALFHLGHFGREAADAEEALEKRESGIEAEVGARGLTHGLEVVADERW